MQIVDRHVWHLGFDVCRCLMMSADGKGAWGAADAVAGDMVGQLMGCIRPGGTVHVYGVLSGYTASVHALFQNQSSK